MVDYRNFTIKTAFSIVQDFLELYRKYNIEKYSLTKYEQVVVVEDSAILYIKIDCECDYCDDAEHKQILQKEGVCGIDIEELTKNTVFPKYNHTRFCRTIERKYNCHSSFLRYARFQGTAFNYLPNGMRSAHDKVTKAFPELGLDERIASWPGEAYTFVAYRMEDIFGRKHYAVDAIRANVHAHILNVADRLLKQPYDVSKTIGIGLTSLHSWISPSFIDAFKSFKNERKVHRLEEHLKYFSLGEGYFKSTLEIRPFIEKISLDLLEGLYESADWISYAKPEHKWKTEELTYKIVKRYYNDLGVIYQHRPNFLKSSIGGQMSYDIYISDLRIAIEYQGKQHFEPVDFFGGFEAFEKLQQRDLEKANLSKTNGVDLIYINYWENVTLELIKTKIDCVLSNRNT